MSLSRPGSRCPACGHPIRWYDNVPILGWLMLRRPLPRLRRARSRPAIRWSKLLVAVSGTAGAGRAHRAGLDRGADGATPVRDSMFGALRVLPVAGLHARVAAALIEFDGNRAAARLMLAAGARRRCCRWAHLARLARWPRAVRRSLRGVATSGAGLLAAAVLGGLAWPALVTVRAIARRLCERSPWPSPSWHAGGRVSWAPRRGGRSALVSDGAVTLSLRLLRARSGAAAGRFGWAACAGGGYAGLDAGVAAVVLPDTRRLVEQHDGSVLVAAACSWRLLATAAARRSASAGVRSHSVIAGDDDGVA